MDIIGLSEINLNWNKFSSYDRLSQRTSKWWENTHCNYSFNAHDVSTSKFQPGGTALLSINQLSNKVQHSRKYDPSGLGRWVSTLYQGQNQKTLRIIQLYRPCKPNPHSSNGVYQQHSRYLLQKNITTCPRTQMLTDLHDFITLCKSSHEQLIVMGDFNEDTTLRVITSFFTSLGMHNLLHTLHSDLYTSSLHSHSRGKTLIDGIFATQGISVIRGGILEEHKFESDHKLLWVDLSFSSIFGTHNPPFIPPHCRRLKNEDPRVVHKFNSEYSKLLSLHRLPEAINNLNSTINYTLTPQQQTEFERIDSLRTKCLLRAERKCRKLKTGNIEFSPTIQHQRNLIRFWKLILKRRLGQRVDSKYLSRWERKLNLKHTFQTPIAVIKSNIKSALQH